MEINTKRCPWCEGIDIYEKYHDEEWGRPVHDDRLHFEHLVMESMQCGLNWLMMLRKREIFRKCFDNFDYNRVALYDEERVSEIIAEPGMIRSPQKVNAIINNAKCFIKLIEEFGSYDRYIWSFTGGKTYVYCSHQRDGIPVSNELSDTISKDLKKRGFKYIGTINIYSYIQACGIINDHEAYCPMYDEMLESGNIIRIED